MKLIAASILLACVCIGSVSMFAGSVAWSDEPQWLSWSELPPVPDELGYAGPFAGVHNGALIMAGGANFAKPVWENEKRWHDQIFVLAKSDLGKDGTKFEWKDGGKLSTPIAYGSAVSTADGVVCIGGSDSDDTFADVFLLQWDGEKVTSQRYPSLPRPCAHGAATLIDETIYLAGGQHDASLQSTMSTLWSLDLSQRGDAEEFVWKGLPPCPGPSRAFNLTVAQHNGYNDCVYVISGRRQHGDEVEFLKDVWEYTPATQQWRERKAAPRCVMAGTGIGFGQSHLFVLGGADGSLFLKGNELKDDHPGFVKKSLAYHTITDTWIEAGPVPQNQVTTIAVKWDGSIIIPSGEIRPRVRSPKVYRVTMTSPGRDFGMINYAVLFGYLLAMVSTSLTKTRAQTISSEAARRFRGGRPAVASLPPCSARSRLPAFHQNRLPRTGCIRLAI
ncbi:hypothetical protein [Stieleria maiorica]|uniref:hypothetical protein n=1 Tax=Stieleria maiorica TaxID=2795974 RepID=UPI001F3A3F88|nr:hypothetical protein [Stieleria maiorica]